MKIFCMRYDCIHNKNSKSKEMIRHGIRYRGTCTRKSIEIEADNTCGFYEWNYEEYNPAYRTKVI